MKARQNILLFSSITTITLALGACTGDIASDDSPTAVVELAATAAAPVCADGPAAPLAGPLQSGLVALYRFDECAGALTHESTGLGTDGTLYNFPSDDSQWVAGKIGGGLHFRGPSAQDHVIAPDYIKPTSSMTASAWVWADSRPSWGTVVKNWGNTQRGQFHFGFNGNSGRMGNYFDFSHVVVAHDPSPMPTGSWQHVAFVADAAAQTMTVYRNGVAVAGPVFYDGVLAAPTMASLGIGAKTNTAGTAAAPSYAGYWHGILDDLAIWNRALSDDEIALIHDEGDLGISVGEILDTSPCDDPSTATILGTAGNDYLVGTPGDDIIFGLGGDDVIDGQGGNDVLCGGAGLDSILGREGNDFIYGGPDFNWLRGHEGDDIVFGGDDGNEIQGNEGDDALQGGAGSDTIYSGGGHDMAHGRAGDDDMFGNDGDDQLFGGEGDDWMLGGEGNDCLDGGADDDTLLGEGGDDNLTGGDGADGLSCGGGDDTYSAGEWDFSGCETALLCGCSSSG